jgi:WD40 repeat protein
MRLLQHPSGRQDIRALAFHPAGRMLVAEVKGGFAAWDLDTGERTFTTTRTSYYCWAFAFDPLGRWLYVSNPEFRFYPPPYREFQRLPGTIWEQRALSLAVAPDGSRLAVDRGIGDSKRLECLNLAQDGSPTLAWSRQIDPTRYFSALAFDPAGTRIAALQHVQAVSTPLELLDASSGTPITAFGEVADFRSPWLAFTPQGGHLVVGEPLTVGVWDIATQTLVGLARRHGQSKFSGMVVHPSGEFFATSAGDRCVRLWSLPGCQPRGVLKWDIGKLHSIAFSRDGMLGAAGGQKGQVVIWDVDADA